MITAVMIAAIFLTVIEAIKELDKAQEQKIAGKAILGFFGGMVWVYVTIKLIAVARFINGTLPDLPGAWF